MFRGLFVPSVPGITDAGSNTLGVSNLGNTAGTTGVVSGAAIQYLFAGGNNVTLSQSRDGAAATLSIVGANQSTQPGIQSISAGTTKATTGEVVFADSNGVSFGVNGQTVTGTVKTDYALSNHSHGNPTLALTNLSGTTDSNSAGFTLSLSADVGGGGLTNIRVSAGTTSNLLSALTFANGNGVSFGLDASTITASHNALTSQSNQALSGSNGSFTFQTATFGALNGLTFYTSNGSMVGSHNALTTARASNDAIGLNTAQSNVTWTVNSSGLSLDARGYAGTGTSATNASLTLNSNGLAVSVAAPGAGAAPQGSFFVNMGVEAQTNALTTQASSHNSLFVFPLNPFGAMPFDITANTFMMRASISGSTATQATQHTTSWRVGVYTLSDNGSFHLLNSVLVSYTLPTRTDSSNGTFWQGRRWLSIHSSAWSSQPVFKAGSLYFIGILLASSSRANQTWGWEGLYLHSTGAFSGTVGVNSTNNTWMNHIPGHGIYTSNTTGYSTFPTPIANSQIQKTVTNAKFVPIVVLNNVYATF